MKRAALALALALLVCACDCGDEPPPPVGSDAGGDATTDASADGTVGSDAASDGTGGGDGDGGADGGLGADDCAERARWIYVVDSDDNFFRFDPPNLTFTQIGSGPLDCPNTAGPDGGVAHPFSMAIDEHAIAWVLYDDGDLYRVSTLDGTCEATAYVPGQLGFTRFGMGFSSNAPFPDRMGETLYIARGLSSDDELATLSTTTLTVSFIGGITGVPELTGNGNAQLWGFFPENDGATIRQLNKATGGTIASYDTTMMAPDTITTGTRQAWAFAFWGGSYYVFYKTNMDSTTDVYRFTPGATMATSTFTRVIDNSGRRIVGAGVSTCAPIIIE